MHKRLPGIAFGIAVALAQSGCDGAGRTASSEHAVNAEKAIDSIDGILQMQGTGIWYSQTHGFDEVRDPMRIRPPAPVTGILIITDKTILFAQWNGARRRFSIVRRISLKNITSVSIDRFGAGRRLVLHGADDFSDSFEFVKSAGRLVDAKKTEQAAMLLEHLAATDTHFRGYP